MGFHFRGDSELLLLYAKGKPRPVAGSKTNLWLAARPPLHSEKPQLALEALVEMAVPAGGVVLDLYAGESASMALCCRRLGRQYIGAELDLERHRLAQNALRAPGLLDQHVKRSSTSVRPPPPPRRSL